MKTLLCVAALTMGCLAPAMANAADFHNGSFEKGSFANNTGLGADDLSSGSTALAGWTVTNSDILWISNGNNYDNLSSDNGSYFLDLTGASDAADAQGRYGGVSQTFSTVAGGDYNVSFYIGSSGHYDSSNDLTQLEAAVRGTNSDFIGDFAYVGFPLTGDQSAYQLITFGFEADSSETTLTFTGLRGLRGGQQFIGLDNVSVTRVGDVSAAPEPGLWSLMLAGVGGAGLMLRGRRKRSQAVFA